MLHKSASTKYLGVLLDNELNWADHINKTVEKTNKRIRAYEEASRSKVRKHTGHNESQL